MYNHDDKNKNREIQLEIKIYIEKKKLITTRITSYLINGKNPKIKLKHLNNSLISLVQ